MALASRPKAAHIAERGITTRRAASPLHLARTARDKGCERRTDRLQRRHRLTPLSASAAVPSPTMSARTGDDVRLLDV